MLKILGEPKGSEALLSQSSLVVIDEEYTPLVVVEQEVAIYTIPPSSTFREGVHTLYPKVTQHIVLQTGLIFYEIWGPALGARIAWVGIGQSLPSGSCLVAITGECGSEQKLLCTNGTYHAIQAIAAIIFRVTGYGAARELTLQREVA